MVNGRKMKPPPSRNPPLYETPLQGTISDDSRLGMRYAVNTIDNSMEMEKAIRNTFKHIILLDY